MMIGPDNQTNKLPDSQLPGSQELPKSRVRNPNLQKLGPLLKKHILQIKVTHVEFKQAASLRLTRVSESFSRGMLRVITPPKSGPGSGLLKRAKTGVSVSTTGILPLHVSKHEKDLQQKVINTFHTFDVIPKVPFDTPPLTAAQVAKAKQIGVTADQTGFQKILDIQAKPKSTRQDFDLDSWQALDKVNFALTEDHLENLCDLFNSDYHSGVVDTFKEHGDWNESLVAETLAKALAYTEGLDGQKIKIPVKNESNRYELKEFAISKFTLGQKLPCYVLTCPDEKSWIVPRGTEVLRKGPDGKEMRQAVMESILADCDPKGIGFSALNTKDGRVQLEKILDFAGESIAIAGHSLGGLFANEIAAQYPDRIENSYGFSAPGISRATFNALSAQQKESLDKKIINFQTEGDLVPSAGRHVVGKNFAVSTGPTDAIHAHLQHNLNCPGTKLTVIDTVRESQKLMRRISEGTRVYVGQKVLNLAFALFKAPAWYHPFT